MNIRETATIRSPNGINEECAKFIIDNIEKPFVLKFTTDTNEKYVFSAWVMSDVNSTITVESKEVPVTTEWKRQKAGYTASGSALKIYFNKKGTYYFYKSQLEIGEVATDWSPSPEDIEESLKATNAKFELVVNKETLKSEINALADTFSFTGNGFVVNAENLTIAEDGTIKALSGEFTGKVTADSGEIGKWIIGKGRIYSQGSDGLYTKIQSTNGWSHAFVVGAPNKDNSTDAPLYVTHAGKLYAKNAEIEGKITSESGKIGGWEINPKRILAEVTSEDGTITYTKLQSDPTKYAIAVGGTNKADATGSPFYVRHNGEMHASNAEIEGKIISTEGKIGGFDIKDNRLESGSFILYAKENDLSEGYLSIAYGDNINCASCVRGGKIGIEHVYGDIASLAINNDQEKYYPVFTLECMDESIQRKTGSKITLDPRIECVKVENTDKMSVMSPEHVETGYVQTTDVRSVSLLYLKCNGTTANDDNRYAISFSRVNFGTADSPTYYGCFRPREDNFVVAGSANYRFRNVYSTNGVSTTSDRKRKHNIKELDNKYIQLFDKLQPVSYVLNDGGERTHVGFISQDVESAMNEIGMNSMDFAGFCKDIIADDDGNAILDVNGNEQEYYSLRYSEFIAINTAKIKQLENKINEVERIIKNYGN